MNQEQGAHYTGGDDKFYLTTPIYYPSDKLHIGHSYTTVAADTIARYQRLKGKEVMFLTGMDEHGQKIQAKAEAKGMTPKAFVDQMAVGIKALWSLMNISYDQFIRTTDDDHEAAVAHIFQALYDKGAIYKGTYEGWYCTSCEAFWTETQLVDGCCPDCGGKVTKTQEESYFFRLSDYGQRLLDLYEAKPDFLLPDTSRNEMRRFIEQGLADLAVSRTSFDWGVKVPFDERHVIYVWIDALSNYITAMGYPEDKEGKFKRFWPANVHLVGKEIVRFHAIIWPAILMALDLPLPEHVFGHGWLLMNDSKMSKSKGNVVDPVLLCGRYGVDALRYFLLREVPFGLDGNFSNEALVERINSDLANDLGNLLSRSTAMAAKYFAGHIPDARETATLDDELPVLAKQVREDVNRYLEKMQFSYALQAIWKLVGRANKYIDETEPWKLGKDESKTCRLAQVMAMLLESLRVVAVLIQPFMPWTSAEILKAIGLNADVSIDDAEFGSFTAGRQIVACTPLFPRLDLKTELEWLEEQLKQQVAGTLPKENLKADAEDKKEAAAAKGLALIQYQDFSKLDLVTAKILSADKVEGADRLLCLQLDIGEARSRTVVSGIAEYYTPETLIGRQVILLKNLAPRKIRGIESRGMLLCAEDSEGRLSLLGADLELTPGSKVG